ncbi:hypothetical protein [Streptomyces afghaniensis]|uniref:hypothetical protein n=1 Tax=Streptomyces afghaniensis TaxID=66865 RepID=UPI002783EBC1|nr:hypothetical protein [Streptomyces afghaniensis]MDQ1018882.1 hypothetical protein [Streptomyces afghaniensis]
MASRPTPAQTRALALIAGGRVRLIQVGLADARIDSPDGPVARSTFEVLARENWVEATGPTSQPLGLTATGQSLLPDRTPAADPEGPTGDQVLAIALRAAIRTGDVGIVLHADPDEVEITGPDDTVLVSIKGRRFTGPDELARFLGVDTDPIHDAR